MPFISRVCFWRRARSRIHEQETHARPQMVGSRLENATELAIAKKMGTIRQETARTWQFARCRLKSNAYSSWPYSNFQTGGPPTSGDIIKNKRRPSPLVVDASLAAGVKRTWRHSIADSTCWTCRGVGQGNFVPSQQGARDLGPGTLVAALCRRQSTNDGGEIVCKWCKVHD
jgi:hypothetical protein